MNAAALSSRKWLHSPATWLYMAGLLLMTFTFDPESFGGIVSIGIPFILAGSLLALPELPYISDKYAHYIVSALLYVAAIVFSMCFLTTDQTAPAVRVGAQVLGFVLYLYILRTLQSDGINGPAAKAWTDALAISGCVLSLHYLSNIATLALEGRIGEAIYQRYTGGLMSLTWGASNIVASALLMPLFASLLALTSFGKRSWVMWLPPAIIAACILAAMSRGVLVSLAVGGLVYASLGRNLKAILVILATMALVCVAMIWFIGVDDAMTYVDLRQGSDGQFAEFNGRTALWEDACANIASEFPFPVGYYGCQTRFGHGPHNVILVYLLEIGIWGLFAFVWFNLDATARILGCRAAQRRRGSKSSNSDVFLCGLIAILLHLLVEDAQYTQVYGIYYWTFMALLSHHTIVVSRTFLVGQSRRRSAWLDTRVPECSQIG